MPVQANASVAPCQVAAAGVPASPVNPPIKAHTSHCEVRQAFATDPALANLRYDLLQHRLVVTGDLPWPRHGANWSETDFASLEAYLEGMYGFRNSHIIHDAMLSYLAEYRSYNPFLEYLKSLPPWDKYERVPYILQAYLGAEDNPYTRAILRKVMVAIIRRSRCDEPVKFDNMLVLNGPQGIGKSTLFAKLGGKWFTDSLTLRNMCDKSGYEIIQGKILAEVPELAGIAKTRMEDVKRFLSSYEDTYRPPYALEAVTRKRITVLVGTVNATETGFLRDITGNRRFWPVRCSANSPLRVCDLYQKDIDLFWAEAYFFELHGESLILTHEQEAYAEKARQADIEADEWEGIIGAYLDTQYPPDEPASDDSSHCVDRLEIWVHALGRRQEDYKPRLDGPRISRNLMHLGWQQAEGLIMTEFGRQRYFVKK